MKQILSLALALVATAAVAAPATNTADVFRNPDALKESIKITQKLGEKLPLETRLIDENGKTVRLGDYFGKNRPVIITPVYYECPMLCGLVLDQLVNKMADLRLTPGKDFEIVTYSFNPKETTTQAAEKKRHYVRRYGRSGAADGWHFTTAEQAEIGRLSDGLGFKYAWDPIRKEYAHGAAVIVATPDGRISRYFYGIDYSAKDLRLGLVDSSGGKIGNATDQFLLLCYHYDPATGKYSARAFNVVRFGGAATVLGIAGLLVFLVRKERSGTDPNRSSN